MHIKAHRAQMLRLFIYHAPEAVCKWGIIGEE